MQQRSDAVLTRKPSKFVDTNTPFTLKEAAARISKLTSYSQKDILAILEIWGAMSATALVNSQRVQFPYIGTCRVLEANSTGRRRIRLMPSKNISALLLDFVEGRVEIVNSKGVPKLVRNAPRLEDFQIDSEEDVNDDTE